MKRRSTFVRAALLLLFFFPALIPVLPAAHAQGPAGQVDQNSAAIPGDTALVRENSENPLVEINTSMGSMVLELFVREAPETVANFLGLASGTKPFTNPETGELVTRPFYDGLIFHRVIDGFMIQGGSPTGLGDGSPGYTFADEINARSLGLDRMPLFDEEGRPNPIAGIRNQQDLRDAILTPLYGQMGITSREQLEERFDEVDRRVRNMTVMEAYQLQGYRYNERLISRMPVRGVIAMANSGPATNGSQFFITLADTDWLAGKHTVFGRVRSGLDVLDAIGAVPVDANSRPRQPVRILSIREIDEAAGETSTPGQPSPTETTE